MKKEFIHLVGSVAGEQYSRNEVIRCPYALLCVQKGVAKRSSMALLSRHFIMVSMPSKLAFLFRVKLKQVNRSILL